MSAHTPGPWGHGVNPRHILAGDDEVARAIALGTHRLEEAKANAALIAAAPDLLAALERVGCQDEGMCGVAVEHFPDGRCFVCAAIAKARGER